MPKKSFAGKLASAHHRLVALQDEASLLPDAEGFAAQLTDLREQLEELEVAHEELEQQNEELLETREELERQRHRYRHLFDEAPFGYLVTDLQGRIEEANRVAAEMAGDPPEPLRRQAALDLPRPGVARDPVPAASRSWAAARRWTARWRCRSSRGAASRSRPC